MPRDQISVASQRKLRKLFALTLDTNNDGLVNWTDFEAAIENMVPKDQAEKNSRLKILRKRLEQHYQKYFWDLCEVGDANKDGNIDLDEWLDVMNDIIAHLKEKSTFPEWYEGLHKGLWRSNEFFDDKNVLKEEFVTMMFTWEIDEKDSERAFDYITDKGKKKLDYALFSEFMKEFLINDEQGHPINMGLEKWEDQKEYSTAATEDQRSREQFYLITQAY